MKRTMIISSTAVAFLALPAHGQLVTYSKGHELTLSGGSSLYTSAFTYLMPPSGCFPAPDTDSDSHNPPATSLFPGGGADNYNGSLTAEVTSCEPWATINGHYGYTLFGQATTSSLHASYSAGGRLIGEANDTQRPCEVPALASGGFSGTIASGHSARFEFNVTETCFMKLDAQAFYLGDAPGHMDVTWSTDLACLNASDPSGFMSVDRNDPLDVTAALCCVAPGKYFLNVSVSAAHSAGGTVSCFHQFAEDGAAMNTGFTLNVNFQDFCTCTGDVNNDGVVDINDLLAVINGWGACPAQPETCPGDINGDGVVDINDLLAVINGWGACPCCLE